MHEAKKFYARIKSRRSFLFLLLSLTSTSYISLFSKKAEAKNLKGIKVIVVGSGISGLAAAKRMKSQGAIVTILEAKNRIGGRLYTDYELGAPFEVGAGWIHGPSNRNPVKKLANKINAETFITDDSNYELYDQNGEWVSEQKFNEINRQWEDILDHIDNEIDLGDTRSLADVIEQEFPNALEDPLLAWAFSAYTEFNQGGPIEKLSAFYHDEGDLFSGKDVILPHGYDPILKPLAKDLDIRLNQPVVKISYGGDGVTVSTREKNYSGDYVVCSVPLGILKRKKIKFHPPLPKSYQQKIDRLGFGSVTKIALKFEKAFWDPNVQYFGIASEPKGRWNLWLNYRTFSEHNILLGLSFGAYANEADKMSASKMTKDALSVLESVWGSDVTSPSDMICTNWSKDKETFGAYSFPNKLSVPSDFDGLADGISGDFYKTLFLCGEHTTFDYAGTLHGAYITGIWAAEAIAEEETE